MKKVCASMLVIVTMMGAYAWAHPDLQLQIDELTVKLAEDPGNTWLLLRRADLHRRHNNWGMAREDFRLVRQIQPDNKDINWFEGRLEVESGQPRSGITHLDEFLAANPDHLIALQNRAQGYLLIGQPLQAAADYHAVIKKSSKPGPALYSANVAALITAGTGYYPQAMEMVREGLLRFPAEISLTGTGTDISLAVSDVNAAHDLINSLPASVLGLLSWETRMALFDCEAGRKDKALQWFTRAIERPPQPQVTLAYLSEEWLQRLAVEPTPENCQTAALGKLQTR